MAENNFKLVVKTGQKSTHVELTLLGNNPMYVRRRADTKREFLRRNHMTTLQPGDGFTFVMDDHLHVIRHSQGTTPTFESCEQLHGISPENDAPGPNVDSFNKRRSDASIADSAPHPKRAKMAESAARAAGSDRKLAFDLTDEPDGNDNTLNDEEIARQMEAKFMEEDRALQRASSSGTSSSLYGGPTGTSTKLPPIHSTKTHSSTASSAISPYSATLRGPTHSGPSVNDRSLPTEEVDDRTDHYYSPASISKGPSRTAPSEWQQRSPIPTVKKSGVTPSNNQHHIPSHRTGAPTNFMHSHNYPPSASLPTQTVLPIVVKSRKPVEEDRKKVQEGKRPNSPRKAAADAAARRNGHDPSHQKFQVVVDDSPPTHPSPPSDEDDDDSSVLNGLLGSPNKYTKHPKR